MANRKVLINYHTSGSSAPTAADVFHGELVVAHETGKETIFTKNNANEMVPFISCAQTIAIIDSKIQSSDTDVQKAEGEAHLNIATGETPYENHFTINTVDVQSEEEFKAYSADTKIRIDNVYSAETALTAVVSALTDVVLTGISGDTIIVAEPVENGTGSNAYNLTHRAALETSGFNKLTTDAYGHVVSATAVATADIQALGFKTSAETGEDLEALSGSVIALSAGTLHDIEALSGDVVEYVKVVSGNIETVINALSAGTVQLSADTYNTIKELSAGTVALGDSVFASAKTYTDEQIDEVYASGASLIAEEIAKLDSEAFVTAGKYLTGIAIADGKISGITEEDLPTLSVESAGTGNVVSMITVEGHKISYQTASVATSEGIAELSAATIALSAGTLQLSADTDAAINQLSGYASSEIAQLSGATEAISGFAATQIEQLSAGTLQLSADTYAAINQLSGYAHGEIAELSGAVVANETDIDNLSAATLDLSAVTLTGVSLNDTPLAVSNHIVSVPVTTSGSGIAAAENSGSVADALAVKEYVEGIVSSAVNYKGATDDQPSDPVVGDLWIAESAFTLSNGKNVEVGDFIIYGENGWDVIEKNLDGAITGSLTQDTVTLGDGLHTAKSLANGASGQVLTIANGKPEWIDDPELSVVSAGTGNVITDIAVDDHEITFTKGITAASDADLQTLSGATEAISGFAATQIEQLSAGTIMVSGFAHGEIAELSGAVEANEDAIEALSAGTIALVAASAASVFASAKTYTDEEIEKLSAATDEAIADAIDALDSSSATSSTGHYMTAITIENGKISSIGEAAVPAAVPVTTVDGTTGDTAAAVLTGVVTGGTDGHQLTLNATNKIFSAVTSDSAVSAVSAITSQSAQTSVSANMAYELSSAATITSGQVTDLVEGIQNVKVDSATTSESADTAAQVAEKLTVTDVDGTDSIEYDGSAAKSITFGTVGEAGLDSMSMTDAGVVDVDVIDCGSY